MKTRRFPLLALLVGLLLTTVGLVLPIIFIRTGGAAISIIGGADAPTYWYIVRKALGGFPLWLDLLGAAMILTSLPPAPDGSYSLIGSSCCFSENPV
jgi:hypothetical protein